MKIANLISVGFVFAAFTLASSAHADALGSSGDCSVAFMRNASAIAAGLITAALAVGMARLRRYGVKRTYY